MTIVARVGEVVGVVGDVKSRAALMSVWSGRRRPDRGIVRLTGRAALVRDPPLVPGDVTGVEWLCYVAAHAAGSPRDRDTMVRRALSIATLGEVAGTRVSGWTIADLRILSVAAVLATAAGPVFLTEALEGLGPDQVARLRRFLWQEGPGPVIISGEAETLARATDRTLVLEDGRIAYDARTVEVLRGRVLELEVVPPALGALGTLVAGIPGAQRTDRGARIPLTGDWTSIRVLEACRDRRIPVLGSGVREMRWSDLRRRAESV